MVARLRPAFREVVVLSLFVNLLALALPVFVLQVYDRVVFYNGLATLDALVIGIAIALAFDFVVRQARARILQRAAVVVDAGLGERVFAKLAALPLATIEARPASHWRRLFRDVETVRAIFCGPTALLAADIPFVALFVALIFVIAGPIAWVVAAAAPLFLLLAWRSGRVTETTSAAERRASGGRDGLLA